MNIFRLEEVPYLELSDWQTRQVVQSIVSLTSSLVVKISTILVSTISNSQVFLLKKMRMQMQKLLTFIQQKY